MLADFGADVIKIEHVKYGDDVRRMGVPHLDKDGNKTGQTSSFLAMNRGKKSIAIDLSKPEGQALIKELVKSADVLIENFKVGNLKRFNLDYESLKAVNPKLVYCSITGFGQTGPKAHLAGYDPIFQAMSGVMSITGVPDGAPGAGPNLVGYSISDINAGYYATIAILAALNHRAHTGGDGQYIDVALMDSQVHAVSHIAMNYLASGKVPVRAGTASQITCPWQAFDCADKPLMIAVGNDAQFTRLVALLDLGTLDQDERYATNLERVKNSDTLIPILSERLLTQTAAHWEQALEEIGIPSGPINTFEDVLQDEQLQHRQMKRTQQHPEAGEISAIANPINFSETPNVYDRPPPVFAEHSDLVLKNILGLDDAAISKLHADGIIR
jgi:crotonobetainyl-CoA:carnitine CoA-transferase CaiB-like acyl-CoA transferase